MQNIMFLWLQRSRGRCPQSPTRPLTGISCVVIGWFHPAGLTEFPSPRGDKLCPRSIWMPAPPPLFPSPRGDKLCRGALARQFIKQGFRPLAGISCVGRLYLAEMEGFGFHPLAGISCVPSHQCRETRARSFRPLAGISCVAQRSGAPRRAVVSVPSRG